MRPREDHERHPRDPRARQPTEREPLRGSGQMTAPLVDITEASVSTAASDEPWQAAVEAPVAGTRSATYGFDLRGWAFGRRAPATAVDLVHTGVRRRRIPLDDSRPDVAAAHPGVAGAEAIGFRARVNALRY